ncbi:hypothetical protein N0M98_08615 [Paenibacillus doosanensis]|uniref:hypothetical protein n=1 Tax=Paenibacillus doosanensis TaxID=1229154 RepID=UPI0021803A8F|nr:hypothetical protein [Paenibacillus doosanensis]MCS7460202.1 hypothetical protein [Paenibacillus doosanensis]
MQENIFYIREKLNQFKSTFCDNDFQINEDGEFCVWNHERLEPICNFVLIPHEIILISDGENIRKHKYVFTGIVNNETLLDKVEVPFEEIHNTKWLKKWNPYGEIYPNEKRNYRSIIRFMNQSEQKIPKVMEYDSIGWHYYNNGWSFLSEGSCIGDTTGQVRTTANGFKLLRDPKLDPKEAFLESLNMLSICDKKLTHALLGIVLTSIVTTPLIQSKELSPNFAMWIHGKTGLGKTRISNLFTRIFDTENTVRVDSYKNVIKSTCLKYKDCVAIIDDYGTSKTKVNEYRTDEKVESVIRWLGDRQLSVEYDIVPKGMALFTGEKFLEITEKNKSTIARTIRVKMDNIFNRSEDGFDIEKIKKFEQYEGSLYLPTSISYYLEWLAGKLNHHFIDDYLKDFSKNRKEISEVAHARYVDSIAHLINAFNFYLSYGKEKGFITPEEYFEKCKEAKDIFLELLQYQSESIIDPELELFLRELEEIIREGKIVVELKDESFYNKLNLDNNVYGIYDVDTNELKLHWEYVYSLVSENIRSKNGASAVIGVKKIGKMLSNANYIITSGGVTVPFTAIHRMVNQIKCRVITFDANMIPEIIQLIMDQYDIRVSEREREEDNYDYDYDKKNEKRIKKEISKVFRSIELMSSSDD